MPDPIHAYRSTAWPQTSLTPRDAKMTGLVRSAEYHAIKLGTQDPGHAVSEALAGQVHAAMQSGDITDPARQQALFLQLNRSVDANDFCTQYDRNGSPVRNVLTVAQGCAAGMFDDNETLSGTELCRLIKGRDYLTIIDHATEPARTITFKNDAVDKSKPGALLWSEDGTNFQPWVGGDEAGATEGALDLSEDAIIVLHPHLCNDVAEWPSSGQPQDQDKSPFYMERQARAADGEVDPSQPENQGDLPQFCRPNTCAMHAINNAFGAPILNQAQWDALRMASMEEMLDGDDSVLRLSDRNAEAHLSLDTGVQLDVLVSHILAHAPFAVDVRDGSGPFTEQDIEALNEEDDRMILLADGHYVAFRKDDQDQWWCLDSLHPPSRQESPSEFLAQVKDRANIGVVSIGPLRQHARVDDAPEAAEPVPHAPPGSGAPDPSGRPSAQPARTPVTWHTPVAGAPASQLASEPPQEPSSGSAAAPLPDALDDAADYSPVVVHTGRRGRAVVGSNDDAAPLVGGNRSAQDPDLADADDDADPADVNWYEPRPQPAAGRPQGVPSARGGAPDDPDEVD